MHSGEKTRATNALQCNNVTGAMTVSQLANSSFFLRSPAPPGKNSMITEVNTAYDDEQSRREMYQLDPVGETPWRSTSTL